MKGAKIEQAKASLKLFLRSLRPDDLFQVVTFASSVQTFFDGVRVANEENIAAALQRIEQLEAKGGTNIAEALQQALDVGQPIAGDDGPLLRQIVFVTDGQPTVGVTQPDQILALAKKADRAETRLFALGVGNEIDVRLIDDLVEQHRGARDFVRDREKIELKVDALCQKISQPALSDVEIRCDGLESFDVHPTRTRDMFCGEMLQVVGRYRDQGMKTVRLRGKQNGVPREFVFEVEFPKLSEKHTFVQTIWARQHVASLLDSIRRNGASQELVEEVRRLATRYGIVTPYTSQLIVEEGMRLANESRGQVDRFGAFRGPVDTLSSGPATGGPGGTAGFETLRPGAAPLPTGPSAPGAAGPAGATAEAAKMRPLLDLGRARTGAGAIEESLVTGSDNFYLGAARRILPATEAKKAADAAPLLRRAAGRVFVTVGDDLVEQGLPADWAKAAVVIESFSDDYFALLRANPKLREILALGERIVFKDGERIVHVTSTPKKAETVEKVEKAEPIK